MMKQEFETLIGKEVTADTFAFYEALYSATPEGITKADFVALLNVDAIPENPEAIARREARAARVAEIKRQIDDLKKQASDTQNDINYYKSLLAGDFVGDAFCKSHLEMLKRWLKSLKSQITELKYLL